MKNEDSSDIVSKLKLLTKQIKKTNNIELYNYIVEIQTEFQVLVEENRRLTEEVESCKGQADELAEKLMIMSSIKLENSVYWLDDKKGEKRGPFCPNCWETKHVLVGMCKDIVRNRPYDKCPECLLVIKAKV